MDEDLRSRYRVTPRDTNTPPKHYRPEPRPAIMPSPRPGQPPEQATQNLSYANPYEQTGPLPKPAESALSRPAPVKRPVANPKRLKKALMVVILLMFMGGGAAAAYYFEVYQKPAKTVAAQSSPIPDDVTSRVKFPVYYPTPLPSGYTYQAGGGDIKAGLFYFKLVNGAKSVAITQQATPSNQINLDILPKFEVINAAAGRAAVGTIAGQASAIVITKSSLINISTKGSVTTDELKSLVLALAPLKNTGKD